MDEQIVKMPGEKSEVKHTKLPKVVDTPEKHYYDKTADLFAQNQAQEARLHHKDGSVVRGSQKAVPESFQGIFA